MWSGGPTACDQQMDGALQETLSDFPDTRDIGQQPHDNKIHAANNHLFLLYSKWDSFAKWGNKIAQEISALTVSEQLC